MSQRLPSSNRSVRHSDPATPNRWHPVAPRRFTLQVRLRGQFGPVCEVLCTGLEDAVRFGQSEFPVFPERNPWIGLDSLVHKIWILLDPETESTRSSVDYRKRFTAVPGSISRGCLSSTVTNDYMLNRATAYAQVSLRGAVASSRAVNSTIPSHIMRET